jgi:WD40 repeat protein
MYLTGACNTHDGVFPSHVCGLRAHALQLYPTVRLVAIASCHDPFEGEEFVDAIEVKTVAYSHADGRFVVSGGNDGSISTWCRLPSAYSVQNSSHALADSSQSDALRLVVMERRGFACMSKKGRKKATEISRVVWSSDDQYVVAAGGTSILVCWYRVVVSHTWSSP